MIMKKYEKPTVAELNLDESICQSSDCVTIKEHYNNSGKPMPNDFAFNLQCGNGSWGGDSRDNLHALVNIQGGLAWRINATLTDADWAICNVTGGWSGSGKCEAQIRNKLGGNSNNHDGAKACWNKADLVQVFRNGHWENVPIEWHYQESNRGAWVKKTSW